jgi:hypothetical protein
MANEDQFLQDQIGWRRMITGGIDKEETSKLNRKSERQEANLKQMKKQKTNESKSQAYSAERAEDDIWSRNHTFQNQSSLSRRRITIVKKYNISAVIR